ncbi:MarR family winged helix-turn-helix transcriptional regulator [Romboutsia sp.]|uniref:MarR family winged helix-turn-helix transcriptional regulator n=1 Tax=Romboutsia sp. TaxID=1965302 RepID=UPI003F40EF46
MDNKYGINEESELNLSTLVTFTRAEHIIHEIEYRTIREGGLTTSQFGVLEALYHLGDLKIGEIMERMLTTSGNITVVVKNLEKDELITTYKSKSDKRSTMITITKKGRNKIADIFPKHIESINSIFKTLTVEEKMILKEILEKFKTLK